MNLTSKPYVVVLGSFFSLSLFFITKKWIEASISWDYLPYYTNVDYLFTSETYMWRPAIILGNR